MHKDDMGLRPIPDPTLLTTEQLLRENSALKELIETRLDAMDKAVVLFTDNLTRVPTDVDKQIGHLRELHGEKFGTVNTQLSNVQTQFTERDIRVEESKTAANTAIAAAFQAAKEAVAEQNKSFEKSIDKSEKSTGEQINQQRSLVQAMEKSLNDKIIDLGTRITRNEGTGTGRREVSGPLWGVLGATVAALVAALLFATLRPTPSPVVPILPVTPSLNEQKR